MRTFYVHILYLQFLNNNKFFIKFDKENYIVSMDTNVT